MGNKKYAFAAFALVWVAYAAWPYATLYRLGQAIRHGDAASLEALVDWDKVREGIKEDICDTVFEEPAAQLASTDKLPPFGFSFVRGIAANAIDSTVTPEGLVAAAHSSKPGAAAATASPHIDWAFFESPSSFLVLLRRPAAAPGEDPVRIQLELRHGEWKVTRAWLPVQLLRGNSKT